MRSDLPFIALDHGAAEHAPIYQQVYNQIRQAILSGACRPTAKLPSTRELARQLGVSRTTIVNAYDQLFAEGYLAGKTGAGTFVAGNLPDELVEVNRRQFAAAPKTIESSAPNLARRAESLRAAREAATPLFNPARNGNKKLIAFQHGLPALDRFPFDVWARLVAKRWRESPADLLGYGSALGFRPLRETIAAYLKTARGVVCSAEQVIIVAGAQQAFDLAARVLLDAGDAVWLEDPFYSGARAAFLAHGAKTFGVPVDDAGFSLTEAIKTGVQPKLVYVTPSHQMPLGVTMSLQRRLGLLDWASRAKAWIVEDDYDSEFRYNGRPLASLQGLDKSERTLYVGTFSKTLFPSLRLGCLVVPNSLVEIFTTARLIGDLQSPTVDQAVLNDFIVEEHFARHIRRMRALYKERQEILIDEASRELGGLLEVAPDDAGLHLVGWLPKNVCDRCASTKALAHNVAAAALSNYSERSLNRGGLILGYAATDEQQIKTGVQKLAAALA